jgi:chromosomal replication initiation ATPase DnaA
LGIQLPILSAPTFTPPSVDEAIWSETQSVLRRQMTRATYDAVIQGTELLGREKGIYVVGVQSKMAQEWLANRLHDVVQRALSNVLGVAVTIEFRVVNGSR